MGQAIVEKLISELQFTTNREIRNLLSENVMGNQSITNALCKLSKHNEVVTLKISGQTIYLDPEFYSQIGEQNETKANPIIV